MGSNLKEYGEQMTFNSHDGSYTSVFLSALKSVLYEGKEVSPRGQLTKEILNATMVVDPRQSLFVSDVRKLNFSFLCAENLWYLSGRNSYSLPTSYNKNYVTFSDEGIMQGAYGPQIMEQIRYVVNTLKEDPDSRQAVISLWRPNPTKSKDTPCTLIFHFMIRDDQLNLHVTMRSNDIIWGNNFDVPSFSMIQLVVAGLLRIPTGRLYLTANSLHLYERHFDLAKEILNEDRSNLPKSLLLPECGATDMKHHMDCIERSLACHYMMQYNGTFAETHFESLPVFYQQQVLMMAYHYFSTEKCQQPIIERLIEIGSPFGTIYHERNLRKSKK